MPAAKKKPQTRRPAPARTRPAPPTGDVAATTAATPETSDVSVTASEQPTTSIDVAVHNDNPAVATFGGGLTMVQPKYAEPTMQDFVANLRANGQDAFADQIEANAAAAAAIVVDIADDVSESTDIESESENVDIPMDIPGAPEWHQYTHQEVLNLIAGALTGKAEQWAMEADAEMLKGAANTAMVGTLRWGGRQLLELAGVIINLPEGEIVVPPPPPVEAATE